MNITTMQILRKLLLKAVGLLEVEIKREQGSDSECLHEDTAVLQTMRTRGVTHICNTCGVQFSEEVEDEKPQTMGRRQPGGNGSPGRTQTGAQGS